MFSDTDFVQKLQCNSQEENFIRYLQNIQQAITKLSARTEIKLPTYSSDYLARGMGLFIGEQERKSIFYLYSNSKSSPTHGVLITIRGPYSSFVKATVPPFHTSSQPQKKKKQKSVAQTSFLRSISVDLSQLINISSSSNCDYSIPLKVNMESDRAQVCFIPKFTGMYQIYLTSNGDLLNGAPFSIRVTRNDSGIKDTFEAENKLQNDKNNLRKKKILARIIDFIDEKLIIKNFIKYNNSGNKSSIPELSEVNEIALQNIEKEIESSDKNSVQRKVKMFEETADIQPNLNNKSMCKAEAGGIPFSERVNNYFKNIPKSENTEKPSIKNRDAVKHVKFSAELNVNDKNTFSVCSKHIVPEVKEFRQDVSSSSDNAENDREKQLCVVKANYNMEILNSLKVLRSINLYKENLKKINVSNCNRIESLAVSDNLKNLFRKRRQYWRDLCAASSTINHQVHTNTSLQKIQNFFANSCETFLRMERSLLDKKLDFAYSTINDNFLSVKERKMLLLHLLEEEQKLARYQNNASILKPTLTLGTDKGSLKNELFVDEELKSRFLSARNYFVYLEHASSQNENRQTCSLDRKLRKKSRDDTRCMSVTCISSNFLDSDEDGSSKNDVKDVHLVNNEPSLSDDGFVEFTFLKKNFKRTRKSVKSLFNIDVSG